MSTSTSNIYVWVWLPEETSPVPAGVLLNNRGRFDFRYGNLYLERPNAVSLSPTLPLPQEPTAYPPTADMALPSAIRDAAPDAWGRRVILARLTGKRGRDAETADLPENVYLMESASDRIGALDFQATPSEYVPRGDGSLDIGKLHEIASRISAGEAVSAELYDAMLSGTGIGGARPKALVSLNGIPSMVKFSLSTDVYPTVHAEALASKLAERLGIRTPKASSMRLGDKFALVTERFDRSGGARRMMVSGLTLSGLGEMASRYGTYPLLLERLNQHTVDPAGTAREIFERIAFNMAISNNDDHLRNHAAFWDGKRLELTPAYDLSPSARRPDAEMTLTLAYGEEGQKLANLNQLISASNIYGLSRKDAAEIVDRIREVIEAELDDAADEMEIGSADLAIIRTSFLHETSTRDM